MTARSRFRQAAVLSLLLCLTALGAVSAATSDDAAMPRVNINTATLDELVELPQVGPAIAQRIIDYRDANGPFERSEDLMNVRGVGEKVFAQLENLITVAGKESR